MFKFVILGVAIGLVSGQNFQQIQTFPGQTTHFVQREIQPEIHIQSQVNIHTTQKRITPLSL